MLKKSIIFIAAIFVLNIFPVYAAEYTPYIAVDYTAEAVTVYGNARTGGRLVTCYVEAPDNRIVYIGSAEVQNGQYSFNFAIENPVEGTYYGRLKTDNELETQDFSFVYAIKSGARTCGVEYEQEPVNYTDIQAPCIHNVRIEVLSFVEGIYRLYLENEDYSFDDRGTPFFFWRATEGSFEKDSDDYRSVIFKADPGTAGKSVKVMVGIGDGLSRADKKTIILKGNDTRG